MIRLEQLKQLITFYEEGTITKAAERLKMSQPSLTRSLQRLEEGLDVQLFDRKKNKTIFTETGHYTVEQARILLHHAQSFLENIQKQEKSHTQLLIGVCAPGPIYELKDRAKTNHIIQPLQFDLTDEASLISGLLDGTYHAVVMEHPSDEIMISSIFLMKEQLELAVPEKHLLADRDELHLSDLMGLNILLRTGLGTWDSLIASLDQTTFLTQTDGNTFNQLVRVTDLPHFITNITELYFEIDPEEVSIPIVDACATKTFYLSTLRKNKSVLQLFE